MKQSRKRAVSLLLLPVLLFMFRTGFAETSCPVAVTSQERFLSIGFDDLRESDFTTVWPLLGQHENAHATFNKISETLEYDMNVEFLREMEQEIGDHSWFHESFVFTDPLVNGQDPAHPEGDQIPYPSNDQMRLDRGDGKNAFGYDLNESCSVAINRNRANHLTTMKTSWRKLSDKQCQTIRAKFSIMKDESGLLETYDMLSNTYLGTTGSSAGSWDDTLGCYTGGIFTGCRTSANHEIWERILQATQLHYQETYGFRPVTWSMPGADRSAFFFTRDGKRYYDEECTLLYNYLAPMESSLYTDPDGSPKRRSWIQVLRENGYLIAHDSLYPSRMDGTDPTMMSRQMFFNAFLSRRDALAYPTNRSVDYLRIAEEYPESFFETGSGKTHAEQMYDAGGSFRDFIEAIRSDTSNGMVHGEVIDSSDTYSFGQFLSAAFEYCAATGVRMISRKEAYEICFEEDRTEEENLIYNQTLINTAAAFLPNAETVPANPDGYQGDCSVAEEDGQPVLRVEGDAGYLHFGIPTGKIRYQATVRGEGDILIYAIRNCDRSEDVLNGDGSSLMLLAKGSVSSEKDFPLRLSFMVPDNPETAYEQLWEGLGNRVMGIRIEYRGKMYVKSLCLCKEK